MRNKVHTRINVPFCRQSWRSPLTLIFLAVFGTFAWGIHLVQDHRELLAGLKSVPDAAFEVAALPAAANMNPLDVVVRAALVNVAGISQPTKGSVGKFVSVGSGAIVTPSGHVATADHLLQNLKEILVRVQTPSGPRQYSARIVKKVAEHDLAVVKLVSRDVFPYLVPADSRNLAVNELVTAWGDPNGTDPLRSNGQVIRLANATPLTIGKIALTHLITTDAVSHWTQSGGPLVNQQGKLLGINIAVQQPSGVLMGFAVPVHVLVTHFQDVVDFPVGLQTNPAAMGPTATPAGVNAIAVAATRPLASGNAGANRAHRPADDWWNQANAFLQTNVGLRLPSTPKPVDLSGYVPKDSTSHLPSRRILGYSMDTFLGLLLLGFVSGISGGMMTMGGGIIKVIGLMSIFGYGLILVRPVAYITNIFMYGAAALRYRRDRLFSWDDVRPMVPWAMAGVVIGYFVGNVLETSIIRYLLGGFALLLAVKMLVEISEAWPQRGFLGWLQGFFGSSDHHRRRGGPPPRLIQEGLLGLPMGIISGILGITGGVIEVPLQRYVARVPLRRAIANSAVLVFFASLMGSFVALLHGAQSGAFALNTPLVMALILIPGAYVGGFFGAWLTTTVPLNVLRWLYAFLMFAIGGRMFLG